MSHDTIRTNHRATLAAAANQLHKLLLAGLTTDLDPVYGPECAEEVNAAIDALLAAMVSLRNAATLMEQKGA